MRERKARLVEGFRGVLRARLAAVSAELDALERSGRFEGPVCPAVVEEHRSAVEQGILADGLRRRVEGLREALRGLILVDRDVVGPGALVRIEGAQTRWLLIVEGGEGDAVEGALVLSPAAPLALALRDLEEGDEVLFRGQTEEITGVW
ncbi:MAG: GreA/GreB family elongation factor [Deltaproteobacteria bacterium]|nr:GreA/GreB family elongation factor [Deltaproteobacteria bacterium]